ncbi:MAG: HDOD domain-containing protein [Candidatus Accumulibacter sp.]|jgi:HD-like signal output (HDOD) protein|nr:HDOD domain-containing protein [Accumulibacter sp.]
MLTRSLPGIEDWVDYFSRQKVPILRKTARRLENAREAIDHVTSRDITAIVLDDPLMAIRVLAYIQPFRGRHLSSDITTIASAIMMLGVNPFFKSIGYPATVEGDLAAEPQALLGILQVIHRAQRASRYAREWAFERHDIDLEEVTLAALLSDLSEILLWCFAPKLAIDIRNRQNADRSRRGAIVQEEVLGVRLIDLQSALCDAWKLPELLKTLMDENNSSLLRVQNVALAVRLARHSADGWKNAALADDFKDIENLLRIDRPALFSRLDIPEEFHAFYLGR